MTREKLLEQALVEWFRQEGWEYDDYSGTVEYDLGDGPEMRSRSIDISIARLASDLDAELDRIIREAKP